jgi:hypothetical protein
VEPGDGTRPSGSYFAYSAEASFAALLIWSRRAVIAAVFVIMVVLILCESEGLDWDDPMAIFRGVKTATPDEVHFIFHYEGGLKLLGHVNVWRAK